MKYFLQPKYFWYIERSRQVRQTNLHNKSHVENYALSREYVRRKSLPLSSKTSIRSFQSPFAPATKGQV